MCQGNGYQGICWLQSRGRQGGCTAGKKSWLFPHKWHSAPPLPCFAFRSSGQGLLPLALPLAMQLGCLAADSSYFYIFYEYIQEKPSLWKIAATTLTVPEQERCVDWVAVRLGMTSGKSKAQGFPHLAVQCSGTLEEDSA